MIENMCSSSNQQHLHYLAAISWFFVDLVNLNWLPIIILIFCQRQSPASHVLQKIISCQNVRVKKCMELLSEMILDVFIAPVEGSLKVFNNTVKSSQVNLLRELRRKQVVGVVIEVEPRTGHHDHHPQARPPGRRLNTAGLSRVQGAGAGGLHHDHTPGQPGNHIWPF